uniref:Uncharacterized protein n=1 Tax=Anguilla anguilla TaxID=7936 RepID=A0A0E9TGB5_ANGAN
MRTEKVLKQNEKRFKSVMF